jgi:dolichyl-phosphate-mannose-protein mannosyltransferase
MNNISKPADGCSGRYLLFPDLLFAGLLLFFVLLSYTASGQESVTNDEFRHLSTGVHYWQSGDYSFDSATPPLWKMAMALPAYLAGANTVRFREVPDMFKGSEPWIVATDFMRDNAVNYPAYLQSARLVNILAAVLCLVFLYLRCRKCFGPAAALFGTAFLALSPTFLAHSHYATTDVIATLTLMVLVFLLIDYLHKPGPGRLACAALVFALSLLCKFTALLLFPLLLLVPLLVALEQKGGAAGMRQRLLPAVVSLVKSLLLVLVTLLLTVNIFYGFKGTGTPLGQMRLESRALSVLGQSSAGALPIPLPRAFVEGFDRQKADSDFSEFPAYFIGKWSVDGFRSYYLAAFCMKESVPFLLLLAASLLALIRQKEHPLSRTELLLLFYVPLTLFLVLSCMNRLNVGVRYLLPAYPFLCLFIARLHLAGRGWRGTRLVLPLLFVLHSVSVFRIAPHYTSYFNELFGGAANGYHYLIDSNIDWGQDLPSLKRFMTENSVEKVQLAYFGHGLPELYGIDYEPLSLPAKPGYVAISVSLLQGHPYLLTYMDQPQIAEAGQFRSMRNLQPLGRAGYSIMIYRID